MTGVTTAILLRNDYSFFVTNQAIQSVPVFIARHFNGGRRRLYLLFLMYSNAFCFQKWLLCNAFIAAI